MALSKDYYIDGQNTQLIIFGKITTGGGLLLDHVFVVVGGTGLGWQQDFLRLDSEST